MDNHSIRPSVSRETRLLLLTLAVSIVALWVLARIRFQDRPATPLPPMLAQLGPSASYDNLPQSLSEVRLRIAEALRADASGRALLRLPNEMTVTLLAGAATDDVIAHDRPSGLAIVRGSSGSVAPFTSWQPARVDAPRYLLATEVNGAIVSVRPVFVSSLETTQSAVWPGAVWTVPPTTRITPGAFLFATDGSFAGLAAEEDARPIIVPAGVLYAAIDRLTQASSVRRGEIGIHVQALSQSLAAATGAPTGVVVTSTDAGGPAEGQIMPADVIEAFDGEEIKSLSQWRARALRMRADQTIVLRVRRLGVVRDVQLTAAEAAAPTAESRLGLALRSVPDIGSEVVAVERQSAASVAGIQAGDIVTMFGRTRAPSPDQIRRAFAEASAGAPIVVAFTRSATDHRVVTIERAASPREQDREAAPGPARSK